MSTEQPDCLQCAMREHSIFVGLSSEDICQLGMDVHDIHVTAGSGCLSELFYGIVGVRVTGCFSTLMRYTERIRSGRGLLPGFSTLRNST